MCFHIIACYFCNNCVLGPGWGSCCLITFEQCDFVYFVWLIPSEPWFPYFKNGANNETYFTRSLRINLSDTYKNTFQIEKSYTNASSCYHLLFFPADYHLWIDIWKCLSKLWNKLIKSYLNFLKILFLRNWEIIQHVHITSLILSTQNVLWRKKLEIQMGQC